MARNDVGGNAHRMIIGGITRDSDPYVSVPTLGFCEKNQNFAKRQVYGFFQKL